MKTKALIVILLVVLVAGCTYVEDGTAIDVREREAPTPIAADADYIGVNVTRVVDTEYNNVCYVYFRYYSGNGIGSISCVPLERVEE